MEITADIFLLSFHNSSFSFFDMVMLHIYPYLQIVVVASLFTFSQLLTKTAELLHRSYLSISKLPFSLAYVNIYSVALQRCRWHYERID